MNDYQDKLRTNKKRVTKSWIDIKIHMKSVILVTATAMIMLYSTSTS